MDLKYIITLSLISSFIGLQAQVGIGTTTPVTHLHVMDSLNNAELRITSLTGTSKLAIDAFASPGIGFQIGGNQQASLGWISGQMKFYSSPPVPPFNFTYPTLNLSSDRKVGISMGLVGEPLEALHVNGRLKIGYNEDPATEGTMRYNTGTGYFEGHDGIGWRSFTGELWDQDKDTRIRFGEAAKDSIVFIANNAGQMAFDGHRLTLGKEGNTFVGHESTLTDTEDNIGNTMLGWLNGTNMTSGVSNTSVGFWTGYDLTTGNWNTLLGAFAGQKVNAGNSNTMLGYFAGRNSSNTSGNVFIGYRSGENETGNNKLYIDNSNTASPLIYGDFQTNLFQVNGQSQLIGNTSITGTLSTTGVANIGSALQAQNMIANANSPYMEWKSNGISKYYIRYDAPNDRLDIHESGEGDIIRIKNGEIYFPQLAGSARNVRIDASGKLLAEPLATSWTFSGFELADWSVSDEIFVCHVGKELRHGFVLSSLSASALNTGQFIGVQLSLFRRNKSTGTIEVVYTLEVDHTELTSTAATYSTSSVVTSGSNFINLNTYDYFLSTQLHPLPIVSMTLE